MPQEGFGVVLKTVKMISFNEFHESEIMVVLVHLSHWHKLSVEGRDEDWISYSLMVGFQIFGQLFLLL